MRRLCAFLLLLATLAACADAPVNTPASDPTPAPAALPHLLEREGITSGVVEFFSETAFTGRSELDGTPPAAVLDILFIAPYADRTSTGIGEADAVQRLKLYAGGATLECLVPFYTDYALVSLKEDGQRRDFALLVPGLREALEPYEREALIPYAASYETVPPALDPALRASVDAARLTEIAVGVPFTRVAYEGVRAPLFRVLSPEDADAPVGEDELLILTALGDKPTGGFAVEIVSVETTPVVEDSEEQSLARVILRVTEPAVGDWVAAAGSSPADAVIVSADAIPSDSIVLFVREDGGLVGIQAW